MLYDPKSCPCRRRGCPRYRNCEACLAHHRADARFPLTACERLERKKKGKGKEEKAEIPTGTILTGKRNERREKKEGRTAMKHSLNIKRIYEEASPEDGFRILTDRLWPRGISKERAEIDLWAKEITPSTPLRKWFGHKAENFEDFGKSYRRELDENPSSEPFVRRVAAELEKGNVTLLYAAKDPSCNHALILQSWLEGRLNV